MIRTPLSTVVGGAFLTPGATVVSGTRSSFETVVKKLFANNEQGFFYDPNDLSTMFQDAVGTIPVTGAGQPVGLITDKSGRGNHARQTTSSMRPTLQQDSNTSAYYLEFDGVDDYLVVNKANLKFLHDGTGATGFLGLKPSGANVYHTLLNTGNLGNAGTVGYTLAHDNRVGNGTIINVVTNGSGTLHVSNTYNSGTSATPRVVSFKNNIGTHALRLNGTQVFNSPTETGSPSTALSSNDLWIGRAPAGFSLHGDLYGMLCVNRLTTDNETLVIEKELAKRAGATINV